METALPAKLKTYCQSFLTSVSVCAVSHMLHSYLLGVTLIIHVASHFPVTRCNSLLTVFSAAAHVSVFPLCVKSACANLCVCHVWSGPFVPWRVRFHYRLSLCTYMHAPVHCLALFFPCDVFWYVCQPVKATVCDVMFNFRALCRRMVVHLGVYV